MPSLSKKDLGFRLREARQKKGVSQQEVIDYLQSSLGIKLKRSSISNYETGVSFPSLDVLHAIVIYLDTSIDYLVGLHQSPPIGKPKKLTQQFLMQQDEFIILPLMMEIRALKKIISILEGHEVDEKQLGEFLVSYRVYRKKFDNMMASVEQSPEDVIQFQEQTEEMIRNYQAVRTQLSQQLFVEFNNDYYEGKILIKKEKRDRK